MIKEIKKNLFCIPVSLPGNVLQEVNTYLIRGERCLLIDTGFGLEQCEKELNMGLDELGVDRNKLDLYITHFHTDHSGLMPYLARDGMKIYVNEICRPFFEEQISEQTWGVKNFWGLPKDPFSGLFSVTNEFQLRVPEHGKTVYLKSGDVLNYGDYSFQHIYTPGHCEDHGCLYDAEKKLLISGDMALEKITPSIADFSLDSRNLEKYLDSIEIISKLDVETVCPGHRGAFDVRARIEEIKEHHLERLRETLRVLGKTPQTISKIASGLHWFVEGTWDDFPVTQKFFAMAETAAHISYLYHKGYVEAEEASNGSLLFCVCNENIYKL